MIEIFCQEILGKLKSPHITKCAHWLESTFISSMSCRSSVSTLVGGRYIHTKVRQKEEKRQSTLTNSICPNFLMVLQTLNPAKILFLDRCRHHPLARLDPSYRCHNCLCQATMPVQRVGEKIGRSCFNSHLLL